MKPHSYRLVVSVLGGIAVLCVGVCLVVFPMLAAGSAHPQGMTKMIVTVGSLLCLSPLAEVVDIPYGGVFVVAVIFWSALIFGVGTIMRKR